MSYLTKKSSSHIKGIRNSSALEQRTSRLVISRGNPFARVVLIGEAPGAKEEVIGKPFVGRSGKLLDTFLENVGFDINEDIYFCNVIKSRPPNNRRPTKKEIFLHLPWLHQQIALVDPLVVVLVGSTAVQSVLGSQEPISKMRGAWHIWNGRSVRALFHPAYLLRNPSKEKGSPFSQTSSDFIEIRNRLNKLKTSSTPYVI